jgi:hypothetical protein
MTFGTITAEGWVLIIGAIGAVLVQLVLQVFQFLTARAAAKQSERNSEKIDTVTDKLHEQDKLAAEAKKDLIKVTETSLAKQDELKTVVVDVKKLMNGRFTAQIREKAEAYRMLYNSTGDPGHKSLADNAEAELARHLENEKKIAEEAKNKPT